MSSYSIKTDIPPSPRMQIFSMVLGIMSLTMIITGFGLPIGALGLIVALLSRGTGPVVGRAKAGMIMSIVSMCISGLLLLVTIVMLATGAMADYADQIRAILQNYSDDESDQQYMDDIVKLLTGSSEKPSGTADAGAWRMLPEELTDTEVCCTLPEGISDTEVWCTLPEGIEICEVCESEAAAAEAGMCEAAAVEAGMCEAAAFEAGGGNSAAAAGWGVVV